MQRNKDFVRGFLIPYTLNENSIWNDQATYTTQEPFADFPEPTSTSNMFVGAAGDTAVDTDLQIITSRSGVPTTGEFVIINNDPLVTNTKYGANQDFVFTGWNKLRTRSATTEWFKHDALSFDDGTVLIAAEKFQSPNIRKIEIIKVAQNGTTTSTNITIPTSVAFGQSGTPALCVLPDTSILCFVCIETDNQVNVKVYRSTDKGESFSLASQQVLSESIDTDTGSNGYDIEQVRALALNGQIMLVFSLYSYNTSDTYQNHVLQYASVDGGGNFQKVTTDDEIDSNAFYMVDLFVNKNRFCCTYIAATDEVHFMTIPHAFFSMHSLRTAAQYTKINDGGSANDFANGVDTNMTDGIVSGWSSYEQTINVIAKDISDNALVAFYGLNDIDFYSMVTNSAPQSQPSVYFQDTTQGIDEFKAIPYRGGAALVHNWTVNNHGESIAMYILGGYASVTYPFREANSAAIVPLFRQNNTFVYLPIDVASRSSELTTTGNGTESLTDDYLQLEVTTSQNDILFDRTEARTIAINSITARGVVTVVNDDSGTTPFVVEIQTEVASGQYSKLKIDFYEGNFEVYDTSQITPTLILDQTFNVDQGMEFLVTIYEQKAAFFYKYKTFDTLKEYLTGFTNYSLATALTGSTNQTRIIFGISGSPSAETAESRLYQLAVSDGYGIGDLSTFTQSDLIGKKYPSQNYTYIDKGVSIFAAGGTSYINEEWKITTTSHNPIENIFYQSSPSPRVQWRSEAVTGGSNVPEQRIPLLISDNATNIGNDIAGFHLADINFKDAKIEYWSGASWTTYHTFETSNEMKHGFVRDGKSLKQDTTNLIDHSYYFYNELKDYIAMMVNGENTEFKRIVGNSEGIFGSGTSKRCIIELESEPVQTSGTLFIIPKSITVAFDLNGIESKSWSITIPAQKTIDNDFRIGMCLFGSLAISGTQYSKGRRIAIESGTVTNVTPDRTRYSRAVAPDQRSIQISWSDGIDTSAFYENNADPDFYKTSSDASAQPTSVYQDAPYLITGVLRGLQGDLYPLVYLPSISDNESIRVYNRRDQHMLSVLDSEISLESVTGEEMGDYQAGGEVFRVATMTLIEVV